MTTERDPWSRFADRVVVVTGGNSGIGEAAVRAFRAEGAHVVIAARDVDRSERLAGEVGGLVVACDVTSESDCRSVVNVCRETWGRLDVLFNNAGVIYRDRSAPETSLEEWRQTIDVSLTGTFLMSKHAVSLMIEGGKGAIVNNASYFGLVGGRGVAAYSAAKGGVVLLTKAMALDHARDGIRVNCICPGSVDTPMLRGEMEEMGGVEVVRPVFEDKHPLGRISTPAEIAQAVLYLASDDAGFVTGTALAIDGGLTAG